MKKVSTTGTKQNRNFSQPQLTIGPDLGDRSSCYCVLDKNGSIVIEQKVSTTLKALQAAFGAMPRSRITLETGMHSPWVSRRGRKPSAMFSLRALPLRVFPINNFHSSL